MAGSTGQKIISLYNNLKLEQTTDMLSPVYSRSISSVIEEILLCLSNSETINGQLLHLTEVVELTMLFMLKMDLLVICSTRNLRTLRVADQETVLILLLTGDHQIMNIQVSLSMKPVKIACPRSKKP